MDLIRRTKHCLISSLSKLPLVDWHKVKIPPVMPKPSHLGFGTASCLSEC